MKATDWNLSVGTSQCRSEMIRAQLRDPEEMVKLRLVYEEWEQTRPQWRGDGSEDKARGSR